MSDPQRTLTPAEVAGAELDDWRQIHWRIRARFRTGDFATGRALLDRIADAAEAANHHPDLVLTYTDLIVTLSSHDVHGLTNRDVELARTISELAADMGVAADVTSLTDVDLGLDTDDGARLAPFYTALLGSSVVSGELVDSTGQVPTVWWQEPDDGDVEHALPPQSFEQRWHLDVWVPHDAVAARLQAVLDAGGRLVSDRGAPSYWVVEDADGNRACICTAAGR